MTEIEAGYRQLRGEKQQRKLLDSETNKEVAGKINELRTNGLPDAIIAEELRLVPEHVKDIRKRNNIPSMTAAESRTARKEFEKKKQKVSRYDIVDPPLEEDKNF